MLNISQNAPCKIFFIEFDILLEISCVLAFQERFLTQEFSALQCVPEDAGDLLRTTHSLFRVM